MNVSDRASSPLVAVFTGVGDHVTGGDDAFVQMLGFERERFDADRARRVPLSPPEWSAVDQAALRRAAAAGGVSRPYQKEFWHHDGHRVPVLIAFSTELDDPERWVGYAVDLTSSPARWAAPVAPSDERVAQPRDFYEQLVGELVRDRGRFGALLDSTDALIWSVDPDLRLLGFNRAFTRAQVRRMGVQLQIGDPVLDPILDEAERSTWESRYRRVLAGERPEVRERSGDTVRDFAFSPMFDTVGGLVGVAVVGTDVTAEATTRRSLEQREHLLRIASRLGRVAAWRIDPTSRRVHMSDELAETFDVEGPREMSFDEALSFFRPLDRPVMSEALDRLLSDGTSFDRELQLTRPDGSRRWVRVMGDADLDATGAVVEAHGAVADITSSRTAQGKLREQASLLDNATDAILVRGLDGIVTYWNRAAEELYGWTAAEAVGRHIADLVDQGNIAKYREIEDVITAEGEWSGRLDNVDRDGNPVVIELHVNTIRDEYGHPIAVFSVSSDISERVRLEERLLRSQKLEAVGQLTGGIAHDFNNLLTVIAGSAELLADAVGGDEELADLVAMIAAAADRGADLTSRLLAYARRQSLQPEALDPIEIVDQVISLLRRSFPESVRLVVDGPPEPVRVAADPAQLESSLMNIALNARDAMAAGGGTLRIGIDVVEPSNLDELELAPGPYARISVTDDGIGMSADVLERAFDPFFTTKASGAGTGLGLSMVYGFARQSGGVVEIRSHPDEGTVVDLLLPLLTSTTAVSPVRPQRPEGLERGSERVLVVEDDPLVRSQTVRALRRLGYDVVEAADAAEALARFDADGPPIDLLFTDVVMPGPLSGIDLVDELRRRRPDLPVLLTSGYAEPVLDGMASAHPLLAKPYRRSVLARSVRHVLDGTHPRRAW